MRSHLTAAALALILVPTLAPAQTPLGPKRVYLGVGGWTCSRFVEAHAGANAVDQAQAAGWALGFWSAASFYENEAFADMVDAASGSGVFNATAQACRENPDALVGDVTQVMLKNTREKAY